MCLSVACNLPQIMKRAPNKYLWQFSSHIKWKSTVLYWGADMCFVTWKHKLKCSWKQNRAVHGKHYPSRPRAKLILGTETRTYALNYKNTLTVPLYYYLICCFFSFGKYMQFCWHLQLNSTIKTNLIFFTILNQTWK